MPAILPNKIDPSEATGSSCHANDAKACQVPVQEEPGTAQDKESGFGQMKSDRGGRELNQEDCPSINASDQQDKSTQVSAKQIAESSEDEEGSSEDEKDSIDAALESPDMDLRIYVFALKLVGMGLKEDLVTLSKRVCDADKGLGEDLALFRAHYAICTEEAIRIIVYGGQIRAHNTSQKDDPERRDMTYSIALWVASKYLKEEPESIEERATEAAKDKADNFKLFNAFFSMCLSEAFQIHDGHLLIGMQGHVVSGEDNPASLDCSNGSGRGFSRGLREEMFTISINITLSTSSMSSSTFWL